MKVFFYCGKNQSIQKCLTAALFFAWCLVSNFQNRSLDLCVFCGTHISGTSRNKFEFNYYLYNLKKNEKLKPTNLESCTMASKTLAPSLELVSKNVAEWSLDTRSPSALDTHRTPIDNDICIKFATHIIFEFFKKDFFHLQKN